VTRGRRGGDDAAARRAVLDHDLGAGAFGELLRQQAHRDVGKAAGPNGITMRIGRLG
jgi:hypothetical protein